MYICLTGPARYAAIEAGLVNAPPARTEVAMHGAYEQEVELGPFMAHVTVTPAMPGASGRCSTRTRTSSTDSTYTCR